MDVAVFHQNDFSLFLLWLFVTNHVNSFSVRYRVLCYKKTFQKAPNIKIIKIILKHDKGKRALAVIIRRYRDFYEIRILDN